MPASELEREKEKRVAHLQQLGVRRLMQQGLARGWAAWPACTPSSVGAADACEGSRSAAAPKLTLRCISCETGGSLRQSTLLCHRRSVWLR